MSGENNLVNLNQVLANLIFKVFEKYNIHNFHTNPGLRNAPLLSEINSFGQKSITSHFDERGSGYRAIASIKADKRPHVLMSTSGTAAANYYPAVIEAFYQDLPLIICTADRPTFAVKNLANQSIQQNNLFGSYTPIKLSITEPTTETDLNKICLSLFSFLDEVYKTQLPAHLNISFLDPANINENSVLEKEAKKYLESFKDAIKEIKQRDISNIINKGFPEIRHPLAFQGSSSEILKKLQEPQLISIGELPYNISTELKSQLLKLIKESKTPITIDVTSQLKYETLGNSYVIPSVDHPEVKEYLEKIEINNVWHIGNRMTSKNFYRLISDKKARLQCFNNTNHTFNPSNSLQDHFRLDSKSLESLFSYKQEVKETPDFTDVVNIKRNIIEDNPLSFPYISKKIIEVAFQEKTSVILSNSTCIRSFDFFADHKNYPNPNIFVQRGTSGIEGFFSNIIGLAERTSDPKIIAILGDVTSLHDFNSVFAFNNMDLNKLPKIDIYIINDFGGGIFRLLNVPEMSKCRDQMETPHQIHISPILKQVFKDNKNVAVDYITDKNEFYQHIDPKSDRISAKINFCEVILGEKENNKVYKCLKTIRSNPKK